MTVLTCPSNFSPQVVLQGPYSSRSWDDGDCGPTSMLAFANLLTCGAFWNGHLKSSAGRGNMIIAERAAGKMIPSGSTALSEHKKAWNSSWMQTMFDQIGYNKPSGTWYVEGSAGDFDSTLVTALSAGRSAMVAVKYGPIDWYPATSEGDAAYPTRHKISGQWCFRSGHMICLYRYRLASGIAGITDGTPVVTLIDPLQNGGSGGFLGAKCNAPAPPGVRSDNFYSTSPGHVQSGPVTVPVSVIRAACGLYAGTGNFVGVYSQAAASVIPPPVAGFTSAQNSGTLAVRFTDTSTSTATITSWTWAFGDGSLSNAQNPTHTYATAGPKTATLTVQTAYSSDSYSASFLIIAIPPGGVAPTAAFTFSQSVGTHTQNFTDTSTNSPTTWAWNFGDSSTSTVRNPAHAYSAAGSYTVSLNVTNGYGSSSTSHTVAVVDVSPIASYSHAQTVATLTVVFTDLSVGGVTTSWAWDFGDGGTSTSQNPSHTYSIDDDYTVSLTSTNAAGSNTSTQTVTVDPIPTPPPTDPGYDLNPNDPCAPGRGII